MSNNTDTLVTEDVETAAYNVRTRTFETFTAHHADIRGASTYITRFAQHADDANDHTGISVHGVLNIRIEDGGETIHVETLKGNVRIDLFPRDNDDD